MIRCPVFPKCFAHLLIVLAVGLSSQGVQASVIASPHDLYRQGYFRVSDEKLRSNPQCDQCHITSSEDRPQIWKMVPPSLTELGETGILCASCHDGVSIFDRNVDGGLTVFHPLSHGLDPSQAPSESKFDSTGLPGLEGAYFSCLTCHDPHEQTIRPFLRVPIQGLCTRCHKERKAEGSGAQNVTGDHPVDIEAFDSTGGPSPISVQPYFNQSFPRNYPLVNGILSTNTHWPLGGHLSFGHYGKIQCTTCHALHGSETEPVVKNLLAKDPVRTVSDDFCEGCHRGERGDEKDEPPYPNPGGTKTGRTYHPVDDDESNDEGWRVAIADTVNLVNYIWGDPDPDFELPRILCTTCHRAHRGQKDSPMLVPIDDLVRIEDSTVKTFCEVCHRQAPPGHHAYSDVGQLSDNAGSFVPANALNLGHTFGSQEVGEVYCSMCHRAHNAGYDRKEEMYIPILVDRGNALCESCHAMGVSHFLGDPTLPSTYSKTDPPLRREPWPSGGLSYYNGEGELPTELTCLSCHNLSINTEDEVTPPHFLLASATEADDWAEGAPQEYLCTGCHGEAPATVGGGRTHPLMESDGNKYLLIRTDFLVEGEIPPTYTQTMSINCHSCHVAHRAALPGGVYILKVVRGENLDPKAIHPKIDYSLLCDTCHPYL